LTSVKEGVSKEEAAGTKEKLEVAVTKIQMKQKVAWVGAEVPTASLLSYE